MRRVLTLLAVASTATLSMTTSAGATMIGVEANNDLANGNRLAQQPQTLDRMKSQGVGVVRVNMGWNEIAAACGNRGVTSLRDHANDCYNWSVFDSTVKQATERNILVLATVSRAPVWLHNSSNPSYVGGTSREWSRTVQHYDAFMTAAATRYKRGSSFGSVRMWTVWNEPNSDRYFAPQRTSVQKSVMPRRYAQLLGRTAVAIRRADPNAYIAAGPTGPTGGQFGVRPITFVAIVQRALPSFLPGGSIAMKRKYLNGWAHNPYPGFRTAPSRGTVRSPAVGMTNIRDLFRQLDAAPITRGMPVWATEFGWETNPPDRILGISPPLQGRYMGEAFDWLESTRRVPVIIWYGFRDGDSIGDWQSGTWYANGRAKVSRLWFMRPISVPTDSVRRGTAVRVWARSSVRPSATRIVMSVNGRSWRLLPRIGRRSDGTTVQLVRVYRKTWFATWDGSRGPARVVYVR